MHQLDLRLRLEFEHGEPVQGWLEPDGEAPRRFEGALELLAAIDAVHAAGAEALAENLD